MSPEVIFPNLGIEIAKLPSGFYIGKLYIAFYGVVIAIGMILAAIVCIQRAKKTNQYTENYVDIAIISIIAGVIGARIYYVVFALDEFHSFVDVINTRNGGLAIYGGVIGGIIAVFFVCRYKKIGFLRALDTCVPGIILAQAIGRWGNFFNKEAYGTFTDSFFKMQIRLDAANGGSQQDVLSHIVQVNGTDYIQVHPTFLYESLWCILVFILLLVFSKYQQYNGEVTLWYLGGYALERAFVEGLRTDQLRVGEIAVSQLLSVALVVGAFAILLINRIRINTGAWNPNFRLVLEDGDPGTKKQFDDLKALRKSKKKSDKNTWEVTTVETEQENAEEAAEELTVEETAEELTVEKTAEEMSVQATEPAEENDGTENL